MFGHQLFPFGLLNLRPDLFSKQGDENGLVMDIRDSRGEEPEEEIDDEEPSEPTNLALTRGGACKRLRINDVSKVPKKYSDNVNEMCLVQCKLCDKTLSHGSLRDHLLRTHKKKREEFVTYEYVRLTYYRCKICEAETLFTHAAISQHVRIYHNLTFSEYKNNYRGFTGESSNQPTSVKTEAVPLPSQTIVKEISFDNSLLAEHPLDIFLPQDNHIQRLQHLLRNQEKRNLDLSSFKQEKTSSSSMEEKDNHSLGLCDARQTHLTGLNHDDAEEEEEKSDIECDPNMFCEMSMAENKEEEFLMETDIGYEGEEDEEEEEGFGYQEGDHPQSSSLSIIPLSFSPQDDREDGEVRIVTDNLNEMCEFECLLCGMVLVESTLSKHLKEVHQETRREGVTHKYKRLTYYKCKICDKEITFYFAALRDHMVSRHNMKMPEYRARFKAFSNQHKVTDNIKEMCLCRCNICEQILLHHKVKKHMKYKHDTTMKNLYTFIRQTYYRCKICLAEVLFSLDSIRNHLWNHHSLSMLEYRNSCNAFSGEASDAEEGSSSGSSANSSVGSLTSPPAVFAGCTLTSPRAISTGGSLTSPQAISSGGTVSSSQTPFSSSQSSSQPSRPAQPSRLLPPMPRLKNFSHLVGALNPPTLSPPLGLNPALAHLNPSFFQSLNLSKENLSQFLINNSKTFSDKLSEMTVCRCKLCGDQIPHHSLKKHMKSLHDSNLSKTQYEYIRETYYRCKLCDAALLFSFESIRRHVYHAHRLSLKEYRQKHNAFQEENAPAALPEEDKVFSDDPKDMCICTCKVCGEEYLHHLIMKHIRKKHEISSKDQYQYTKLVYYKCKVCGVDFPFSMLNISNHLIQNHKLTMTEYKRSYPAFSGTDMPPPPPKEEEREKIFTDNLDERCICRCNVCGKEMYQDRLGKHSEVNHRSKTGNEGRNEFVLKTYHRCRICRAELLFNLQGIRKHVRRAHDISMDEYKHTYSPFTGGKTIRKGRPAKKSQLGNKKQIRKRSGAKEMERYLFHAMDDTELETRDEEEDEDEDEEDPDFDPNRSR